MTTPAKLSLVGFLALAFTVAPGRAEADKKDPILAKYDADGDGELSREERRQWRADRRAAALKKYDKNKDGRLDDAERAALAADRATAILAALDGDGDGALSRKEVGKARGLRFARLRRGFERIDRDGNDSLSRAELEATAKRKRGGKRARRHKRGAKAGGSN